MKKLFYKLYSITLVFSLILGSTVAAFAADESAYESSLARFNAAIDYLNAEYLDSELGNEFDYGTEKDKEQLTALANYITMGCSTETEKAGAIYDWLLNNVEYGYTAFAPIDVFRNLEGICSGHANLFAALCRLSGIDCAVIRGYKVDSTYVTVDFLYKKGYNYLHEWSMAYCDGEWLLYDDLWGYRGLADVETMAHWNYLTHVDGVAPSIDIMDTRIDGTITQTYYMGNGTYSCYRNGQPCYDCSNAVLQVGGCLRYDTTYYFKGFNSYYNYFGNGNNSIIGNAIAGGTYIYFNSHPRIYKENGSVYNYTTFYFNNDLYLSSLGSSIHIDSDISDNGLTEGELNMYIGQEIDLSQYYPDTTYNILSGSDKIEISNGVIKAVAEGSAWVRIQTANATLRLHIYGDINDSNELFQYLCNHEHTHTVGEYNYCDYCGQLIEIEEPVEEPQEEVVEPTPEEVEETIEEPIEEAPVEEPIEETPVEPVEEAPVEEPIEEAPEAVEETSEEVAEPTPEATETINEPEVVEPEAPVEPVPVEEQIAELIEATSQELPEVIELTEPTPDPAAYTQPEEPEIVEETPITDEPINEPVVEAIEPEPVVEAPIVVEEPTVDPQIVETPVVEEVIEETNETEEQETSLFEKIVEIFTPTSDPKVVYNEPIEQIGPEPEITTIEYPILFSLPTMETVEEEINELLEETIEETIVEEEIIESEPNQTPIEPAEEVVTELAVIPATPVETLTVAPEHIETQEVVETPAETIIDDPTPVAEEPEMVIEPATVIAPEASTVDQVKAMAEEKLPFVKVINKLITSIFEFFKGLFR